MNFAALVTWGGQDNLKDTLSTITPPAASPVMNQSHGTYISTEAALSQYPQPLVSMDGRFVLVGDVRIDNRQELFALLPTKIDAHCTISDGELVLAAYQKWGAHCPAQLLGDFAFVIWDSHKKSIFAARDGMNMRTLCYMRTKEGLCLASTGEQLLKHPEHTPKVSKAALLGWICGQPTPNVSMFEGVEILPAGHALLAHGKTLIIRKFWDIDPGNKIRYRHIHDYQQHLHELLQRAVADRLRSPAAVVASQMSGGMDSTTVTALANQLIKKEDRQLLVISHSYSSIASCDETERINETLSHLGIKNSRFLAAEDHSNLDFRALYPPALESPGTVLSPRYADEMALLRDAGARVLLTGSGGDEMAWGHSLSYSRRLQRGDLAVIPEVISSCRKMELPLLATLRQLFVNPLAPTWLRQAMGRPVGANHVPDWVPAGANHSLGLTECFANTPSTRFDNPALQARYDALQWSSTINSVRSYGQVGAQYGIDVRHPFFDTRLAEFSFAIPDKLWNQQGYPKWLLRRTMNGTLPAAVCWNRKKVIFDNFFAELIRKQATNIRLILADTRLEDMGLLDTNKLLQAFDEVVAGQRGFNVDLLYALMAQIWFQKYAELFKN